MMMMIVHTYVRSYYSKKINQKLNRQYLTAHSIQLNKFWLIFFYITPPLFSPPTNLNLPWTSAENLTAQKNLNRAKPPTRATKYSKEHTYLHCWRSNHNSRGAQPTYREPPLLARSPSLIPPAPATLFRASKREQPHCVCSRGRLRFYFSTGRRKRPLFRQNRSINGGDISRRSIGFFN